MKLNQHQLSVLNAVREAKKASYSQAISSGGNGRTVSYLVLKGYLAQTDCPKKGRFYTLTDTGKAALKEVTKAAKKATKVAAVA
jgi:hypothetical protein